VTPDRPGIRLDKWLFYARFCKSRVVAAALIDEGRVRVNGHVVNKPARTVSAGDVLTLPQGGVIRVLRVLALGDRRGPAAEAQRLYHEIAAAAAAASDHSRPLD